MKKIVNMALLSLLISFISCSEKSDLLEESKSYGKVTFLNNSILGANLGIKYMGEPYANLAFVGPGTFTFYDTRTGEVLMEKELEVKTNDTERWYIFQPDSTIAPQLIRNSQTNDPAAPDGYFKIKIANFSKEALTNSAGERYPNIDVILMADLIEEGVYDVPYDTILSVGTNLDTASYHTIKKAVRNGIAIDYYKLSFLDHVTKEPILNKGGTLYQSLAFGSSYSIPVKNLYTVYLMDFIRTRANNRYIFKNNQHYDISPKNLFED